MGGTELIKRMRENQENFEKNLLTVVLHLEGEERRLRMPHPPRKGDYLIWQEEKDEKLSGKYVVDRVEYKTFPFDTTTTNGFEVRDVASIDVYLKKIAE